MGYSETDGVQNELVLRAQPQVWHQNDRQNIQLIMRYWGELEGEKLTDEDWASTNTVKEFRHQVRTIQNELQEGEHVIGPFRLGFQGEMYESNSLAVKVIPLVDSFRGIRAYFPVKSSVVGEGIQLVVYEYREREHEMHNLELEESNLYRTFSHGGYTGLKKDADGGDVWVQMRYFTLVPRSVGKLEIHAGSFKGLTNEKIEPVYLTVTEINEPTETDPIKSND